MSEFIGEFKESLMAEFLVVDSSKRFIQKSVTKHKNSLCPHYYISFKKKNIPMSKNRHEVQPLLYEKDYGIAEALKSPFLLTALVNQIIKFNL